jgi:hypothetical protein
MHLFLKNGGNIDGFDRNGERVRIPGKAPVDPEGAKKFNRAPDP